MFHRERKQRSNNKKKIPSSWKRTSTKPVCVFVPGMIRKSDFLTPETPNFDASCGIRAMCCV